MTKLPQPIPYQGSKRQIAKQILPFFPKNTTRLVELFSGSAALSVASAYHQKASQFLLNDLNQPLMNLLREIINSPASIADRYEYLWHEQLGRERDYYDFIRQKFNETHETHLFLYLLARCVKASVRYNQNGEFNQSPDNRRKGRKPKSMREQIYHVSALLKNKTTVLAGDYEVVLPLLTPDDLVYLDPPYQGTSGRRDKRYYQGLNYEMLISLLQQLNQQKQCYILSYDGRMGNKQYGRPLPPPLNLHHIEILAGRSTQATLLGKEKFTYESIYLSPMLVDKIKPILKNVTPTLQPQQLSFTFQ